MNTDQTKNVIYRVGKVAIPLLLLVIISLILATDNKFISMAALTTDYITVDGSNSLGAVKLLSGFLHGITYQSGTDYSATIGRIDALKPTHWRLANHSNNVYGFVVEAANYPERFGTKITFVVSDAFTNAKAGYPIKLDPTCTPANSTDSCFATFDELKTEWQAFMDLMMQGIANQKARVDYFDIFNEPDGIGAWQGVSESQFHELFKVAHDRIRAANPGAKIIAPSLSDYIKPALTNFLNYVATNNLRLDGLSWHEFDWYDPPNNRFPEDVPGHVNEMRQLFGTLPALCNPTCPEIHINEYTGPETYFIPGWTVGWLNYLSQGRADVEVANRSCWGCWDGFDGTLMSDNVTPKAIYWVHKAYADMVGSLQLATSNLNPRTIAIASKNDTTKVLRIVSGRYGQNGKAKVSITIENYPYPTSKGKVKVEQWRVPKPASSGDSLSSPIALSPTFNSVTGGKINIVVRSFADGDAYLFEITPQ